MSCEDVTRASVCLSEVLAQIGVTEEIVAIRRNVLFDVEHTANVFNSCLNKDDQWFIFGSQSEGK